MIGEHFPKVSPPSHQSLKSYNAKFVRDKCARNKYGATLKVRLSENDHLKIGQIILPGDQVILHLFTGVHYSPMWWRKALKPLNSLPSLLFWLDSCLFVYAPFLSWSQETWVESGLTKNLWTQCLATCSCFLQFRKPYLQREGPYKLL